MTKVTITLPDMIKRLPHYGVGRTGQCLVRESDVLTAIETFYRLMEEQSSNKLEKKDPPI